MRHEVLLAEAGFLACPGGLSTNWGSCGVWRLDFLSSSLTHLGLYAMGYLLAAVCSDFRSLGYQNIWSSGLWSGDKKNELTGIWIFLIKSLQSHRKGEDSCRDLGLLWDLLRCHKAPLLRCRADMNNKWSDVCREIHVGCFPPFCSNYKNLGEQILGKWRFRILVFQRVYSAPSIKGYRRGSLCVSGKLGGS